MLVMLFTLTTFVAAALLFVLQPMIGKMILPRLGGGPSVWNTCMVFFQAVLLIGYSYAHLMPTRVGIRRHALLHPLLLLLAIPTFHLAIPEGQGALGQASPIPWLIATLAITAGPAFFFISTTSPLLQRWFSATGHPRAANPYFLYAASNAGSFAGLIAYPLLIEPNLGLRAQSQLFTWGYAVFAVLLASCGLMTRGRQPVELSSGKASVGSSDQRIVLAAEEPITWARRGLWVLLAAIPSSLMLGVTQYLSTDVASIPLLWVIPLAVYLLSFMLVFSSRPIVSVESASKLLPLVVGAIAIVSLMQTTRPIMVLFALHVLTFFVACMLCHGRLVALRPSAGRLTEFYLLMSLGGVLGGSFNALVAPVLFPEIFEYPIALGLALAMRMPATPPDQQPHWMNWAQRGLVPFIVLYMAGAAWWLTDERFKPSAATVLVFLALVPVGVCVWIGWHRVHAAAVALAVLLLWPLCMIMFMKTTLQQERSFFGLTRITSNGSGSVITMNHGTTIHGRQLTGDGRETPTTYYHREGPLGSLMQSVQRAPNVHVAVIGLGTGTLAAYGRPGDKFTFFEIDPAMVRLAQDETYFTYLDDAQQRGVALEFRLGDGRLRMNEEADGAFDAILVDAFSSDSIPTHLMTVEAANLLGRKLKPGGLIAYHLSNRHLDLTGVVAKIASETGKLAYLQDDQFPARLQKRLEQGTQDLQRLQAEKQLSIEQLEREPLAQRLKEMDEEFGRGQRDWRNPATWVVLVSDRDDFRVPPDHEERWDQIRPRAGLRAWTDDFSDVISVWRR